MNLPHTFPFHATVVGAGLVGRLLAWRLLRNGAAVDLVEKTSFDHPRSAAHTAAAMISPMSEVVVSERSIYDMGVASLRLWPQWLDELGRDLPHSIEYVAQGSVVVAHPADLSELQQFYAELNHHLGIDNCAEWLDAEGLGKLEPDLAGSFDQALFLPNEASLDNRALLAHLLEAVRAAGGNCVDQAPITLHPQTRCDHPDVDLQHTDLIIDCRGMGAQDIRSDIRGVRGEVLWVETKEVSLNRPIRLMHPRYKLYVVPKPNHRFIIGATEIESQDASPMSVQSVLELCSALYTLNPAFSEARILELDANLRPSLWDNLPIIEQGECQVNGQQKPLLSINGLYRHGYLLAPYLIDKVFREHILTPQLPRETEQVKS